LPQPHADGAVADPQLVGDVPQTHALRFHAYDAVTVYDPSWASKLFAVGASVGETGTAVVGFDFPIGIPTRYASLIGVTEFKPFLLGLGKGDFSDFYRVCETADEISKYRPFYPQRPGGKKLIHLLSALGLNCIDDLRRRCELGYAGRNAASPLFWTLGAKQVGKAAISGWRDVIVPALRNDRPVVLWPFDGSLGDLLKLGNVVVVETYPAECYGWLFEHGIRSKRDVACRKQAGNDLFRYPIKLLTRATKSEWDIWQQCSLSPRQAA